MELFKILEVSIYVILDFLPSLFLAIIPFRDHMCFNLKINFIIITILYFLIVSCRVIGMQNVETAALFSVVLLFIYLIFYILCFRIEIVKLLFVLITIVNYGSFTAITYSFFTTYFRYGYQDKAYSIRSSGILCLILLISYPFMVYLMQKKIKPLIASQVNNKIWNYLWLVPATFCLSYYYNLFSNGGFTGYTAKVSNIINMGGLFATFLVAKLVKDINDSLQLRAENYMLNLQTIQYEHMKNRIEETRRTKHDLRQTIAIMQIFLKDNDTEKLKNYSEFCHVAMVYSVCDENPNNIEIIELVKSSVKIKNAVLNSESKKGTEICLKRLKDDLDPLPLHERAKTMSKLNIKFNTNSLFILGGFSEYCKKYNLLTQPESFYQYLLLFVSELDNLAKKATNEDASDQMHCAQFIYELFHECGNNYKIRLERGLFLNDIALCNNPINNSQLGIKPYESPDAVENITNLFYEIFYLYRLVIITSPVINTRSDFENLIESKYSIGSIFVTVDDLYNHSSNLKDIGSCYIKVNRTEEDNIFAFFCNFYFSS